ncbi:MAG: MT-A70 family methyltransferase [Myxococcaceae bacterium]
MRPTEYGALLADVRVRGIVTPLEVVSDVVLDGRHRLRAARELHLAHVPVVEVALGGEEQSTYLLKAAVLRRHLTDDQRALIAARFLKLNPRPRGGDRRSYSARRINQVNGGLIDPTPGRTQAAITLNVTPARVRKATALLSNAPELAKQVHAGTLKLANAVTQAKRVEQLKAIEATHLPEGVFITVVADVPWRYDDSGVQGAAERHYPTMAFAGICALPIATHAAEKAHCYLWATAPLLREAFEVLAAWGFTYVTTLVWRKPKLGLGRYFRSQTEFVLFGVKGKLPLKANDIPNLFEAPQGRHSEKPEAFFDLVERASPGPYLELFARRQRLGWVCWGAEAGEPPEAGIHRSPPDIKSEGVSP